MRTRSSTQASSRMSQVDLRIVLISKIKTKKQQIYARTITPQAGKFFRFITLSPLNSHLSNFQPTNTWHQQIYAHKQPNTKKFTEIFTFHLRRTFPLSGNWCSQTK